MGQDPGAALIEPCGRSSELSQDNIPVQTVHPSNVSKEIQAPRKGTNSKADLELTDDEGQDMDKLCYSVALFNDDLLGPIDDHSVPIFHSTGHGRCEDFKCFLHHSSCLYCMCLQETVKYLKDNAFVDGKCGNDMG